MKKSLLQKQLSLFIVFCILIAMLPVMSFAADNPQSGNPQEQVVPVQELAPAAPQRLGIGATFTLFSADATGVTGTNMADLGGHLGSYGEFLNSSGQYILGPFTLCDTAKDLNQDFGTCDLVVKQGARISQSANYYGMYGSAYVGYGSGVNAVYKPHEGWLTGTKTRITAYFNYLFYENGSGLNAVVEHGGTATTVTLVPNKPGKKDFAEFIDIGEFEDVTKVTIQSKDGYGYFVPSVTFEVIDDHNGINNAPNLPVREFKPSNEATITPNNLPVPTPNPDLTVRINEVLSDSLTQGDYIELYNFGSSPVDISGWGISDARTKPQKCLFPIGTTIAAGGYIIVRADSSNSNTAVLVDNEYHVNFAISKGGENILLSDANGNIADYVDVPGIATDKVFIRFPDGTNNYRINAESSFRVSNTDTGDAYYPKLNFSHESGFYPESFTLSINSAASGTIRYTTDGSDPTSNSPSSQSIMVADRKGLPNVLCAAPYTPYGAYPGASKDAVAPKLPVGKATIVRAALFDSNGNRLTDVTTKTYFINHDMALNFNNIPVVSVVSDPKNLFDLGNGVMTPEGNNGIGIFTHASNTYYDGDNAKIPDPAGNDWERPASVTLFEADGSVGFHQNVGVSMRGLGSSNEPQAGLTIKASTKYGKGKINYSIFPDNQMMPGAENIDGGKNIKSYDSIALKQGGRMIHTPHYIDPVMLTLSKNLDIVPTQSARPCIAFVDGEYWGIYYLEERTTVDFLSDKYGIPADDIMLKKGSGNTAAKGTTTQAEVDAMNAVFNQLNALDLNNESNYQLFDSEIDIEEMMLYYGMNFISGNIDWEPAGYNFSFWRSRNVTDRPYEDGKLRFIMNDLDCAYYDAPNSGFMWNNYLPSQSNPNGLGWQQLLMKNNSTRQRFANAIFDVMNTAGQEYHIYREMRYWHDIVSPGYPEYMNRWGYNESYPYLKTEIYGLYDKIVPRQGYNTKFTKTKFGFTKPISHLNIRVNDLAGGTVKVNSITPDMSNGSWGGFYPTDITQKLVATPKEGYVFAGWTVSDGSTLSSANDATTYISLNQNGAIVTANFVPVGEIEPYMISSAEDLVQMANEVNSNNAEYANGHFVLTNDIVFTGTENFTAIGNINNNFKGTFDGGYHAISGINTSSTIQGNGLFGYVGSGGIVKNVGVINATVSSTGSDGKNVGGIVGNNAGIIENCYSTGSISGISTVGGIVGNNSSGSVKNCYSIANITSESLATLGGIAGKTENNGTVINSYSLINPVAKIDGGTVDELTSAKTADDFKNGTITDLLNENGTKTVWSNGDISPIFNNLDISLSYIGNQIEVSSKIDLTNVKLIAASYNNEQLIDIRIFDITLTANNNVTKDISDLVKDSGGCIKVMLLSELNNIKPLAKVLIKDAIQ